MHRKHWALGISSIIFKEIMPNLSSILIVEMTLNFAGNVGLETGLSFLGFGLPPSTPSLGTLSQLCNKSTHIMENDGGSGYLHHY